MQDNVYIKNSQNILYGTKKTKSWNPQKRKDAVGRIIIANPTEGERYTLHLLLLNPIEGSTSFTDKNPSTEKKHHLFKKLPYYMGYYNQTIISNNV